METKEMMMVFAYGRYLDIEKDLSFSTRDSHKTQAAKHYRKPEEIEKPPHWKKRKNLWSSTKND